MIFGMWKGNLTGLHCDIIAFVQIKLKIFFSWSKSFLPEINYLTIIKKGQYAHSSVVFSSVDFIRKIDFTMKFVNELFKQSKYSSLQIKWVDFQMKLHLIYQIGSLPMDQSISHLILDHDYNCMFFPCGEKINIRCLWNRISLPMQKLRKILTSNSTLNSYLSKLCMHQQVPNHFVPSLFDSKRNQSVPESLLFWTYCEKKLQMIAVKSIENVNL